MIFLITPTGSRQAQINLCAGFMKRQTYTGKVVWIIIDDCLPLTTDVIPDDFREGWTIIKEHPLPLWSPQYNTQGRNLSVGINTIMKNYREEDIEAIFIIEDDDYYGPIYLDRMMLRINGFRLIGEIDTIYYNVYFRRHFNNRNNCHASLFQVAFTSECVPMFRECFPTKFIDAHLFMLANKQGVNLFYENHLSIGIKGLPGRAGIGAGHGRAMNMRQDFNLHVLQSLIGKDDASLYERFYGGDLRRADLNIINR
ncbi:MAG TPA: hypothetical protein VMV77_08860 [Bacteroidales bacterium]|nr:hypothetical protein [Bacteroidales bacterium]